MSHRPRHNACNVSSLSSLHLHQCIWAVQERVNEWGLHTHSPVQSLANRFVTKARHTILSINTSLTNISTLDTSESELDSTYSQVSNYERWYNSKANKGENENSWKTWRRHSSLLLDHGYGYVSLFISSYLWILWSRDKYAGDGCMYFSTSTSPLTYWDVFASISLHI